MGWPVVGNCAIGSGRVAGGCCEGEESATSIRGEDTSGTPESMQGLYFTGYVWREIRGMVEVCSPVMTGSSEPALPAQAK